MLEEVGELLNVPKTLADTLLPILTVGHFHFTRDELYE